MIKALIVEDEEWVRLGLREQIDWDSLGIEIIGEAVNGADAIEIIEREHTDIVITDIRMPKVDGIALMEYIYSKFPGILIIIISGYSEFEYARKAIAYDAFGYILKPIEEEELELLLKDAVGKLQADKSREEEFFKLKAKSSENSILAKEIFLNDLIRSSDLSVEEINNGIERNGLNFSCLKIAVMVVKNENAGSVYNIIEGCLEEYADCILFKNYSEPDELVMIKKFNTGDDKVIIGEMHLICNKIISTVKACTCVQINIGIGREFANITDAFKSYKQAVEAIKDAGIINFEGIIHIDDVSSRNDYYIYPSDKEKTFIYYLENACKPQLFELIDDLFSEVGKSRTVNPQSIRDTVLELTVSINKVLKKYNCLMKDLLQDRYIPEKIINDILTIEELKEWLKETTLKVMDLIKANKRPGTKKTLDDIVEYMKKHYNDDISLSSVANMFYLNPAYLSRIFKNETGHNFNDYLNKIRLGAAALLINNADLKLSDISEIVGYENVNYFLKKFKEHFRYTPTEYRKNSKSM